MTDAQIEMWLKRLMDYHGPVCIELKMIFDDGQVCINRVEAEQ